MPPDSQDEKTNQGYRTPGYSEVPKQGYRTARYMKRQGTDQKKRLSCTQFELRNPDLRTLYVEQGKQGYRTLYV